MDAAAAATLPHYNARAHVGLAMRGLAQVSADISIIILRRPIRGEGQARLFATCKPRFVQSMATKNNGFIEPVQVEEEEETKKKQEGQESLKSLPPPPERPEPGDCCGSGCVRCVWDVYYEELEAYDKLKDSMSKSS